MIEFNIQTKSKPIEQKYKTENIPSIPRTCIICGCDYLATPAAIKKGGGVVCGRRCQGVRAAKLTPKSRTSIEILASEYIKSRGILFIEQYPLFGVSLADIFIPDKNTAIYCDGEYWHNLGNRKEKDAEQDRIIKDNGVKVYRFTEKQLRQTNGSCVGVAL
jgi:very-short-patch-repair endonuclease